MSFKMPLFNRKQENLTNLLLSLLLILLALLCVFLFFRSFQLIRSHRFSAPPISVHHKISMADVNSIDGWMTFHYINIVFRLPENYLLTNLNIKSGNYSNSTLDKYIENNKLDKTIFINQVKQAVGDYLQSNSAR